MDQEESTQRVKRKRSSASADVDSSLPSHLPPDSINPFSRSPGQLLQFSLAGLADTDEDPSLITPDFPHRAPDFGLARRRPELESDAEGDASETENGAKSKNASQRDRHLHVLLQSIHQFLDRGDVSNAARAYGLVLQMQPHGKPMDIRHHNLWAIGAEILMREGETPKAQETNPDSPEETPIKPEKRLRWGYAANMNKVKAYFETLIQQHPFDHRTPQKLSAVDFWLAMLSCEIYNAHAEHVLSLSRIQEESQDWEDDLDGAIMDGDDEEQSPEERRSMRLNELKEQERKKALLTMRDITSRMDNIGQDQPFPKNQGFLKLRATASLYMADLVVPMLPMSAYAAQEGQERRHAEQESAKASLQKVLELGGELDRPAKLFLGVEDGDSHSAPLYASLPIR